MMCQNFQSVPVPYRTTLELSPTLFPNIRYSPDIVAPYAERLDPPTGALTGLWVSGDRIILTGITQQIYWPSWGILRWEFNAVTGAFIERGAFVGSLYAQDVSQGASGELYLAYITGQIYPLGPAPDYEVLTAEVILPAHFGYIQIGAFFFDKVRNRAVLGGQSSTPVLKVFEFVSGALIRDIVMPSGVIGIVHDEGSRVFVLLANKAVVAVDYETGQFYSYVRLPRIGNVTWARIAWHKAYKRLLVIEQTPDNMDGSCTTLIRGFRYQPVPVHVCKPIPLTRLRDGVTSPVLVKQLGDLGEGIAGLATLTSGAVSATVTRPSVVLDGDGEGRGEIVGTAQGDETVTASVEVPCLL